MLILKLRQTGAGMVEALVALLLLSIAVLGFTGLQINAVNATNEAGSRIQATILAQDLAERMRATTTQYGSNSSVVKDSDGNLVNKDFNGNLVSIQDLLTQYVDNVNSSTLAATDCPADTVFRTIYQQVKCDALDVKARAAIIGATVRMQNCSGIAYVRRCIYVAWNKTLASDDSSDTKSCTNGGTYRPAADCIVLETY